MPLPTASNLPSPEPGLDECSTENLTVVNPGQLTVAFPATRQAPFLVGDKPTVGEGFEAALTYAIAAELGFRRMQVSWVTLPARSGDDRGKPEQAGWDPESTRADFVIGSPQPTTGGNLEEGVRLDASDPYLVVGDETYALLFRSGNPLVTCVNGALAEIQGAGELTALADEWLTGSEVSDASVPDGTLPQPA